MDSKVLNSAGVAHLWKRIGENFVSKNDDFSPNDNVVEGYYYNQKFYEDSDCKVEIAGSAEKIYIDIKDNTLCRYDTDKQVFTLLTSAGDGSGNGNSGVGIDHITYNPDDYSVTICLDDGSEYKTDSLRGPEGIQGVQGQKGLNGNLFHITNSNNAIFDSDSIRLEWDTLDDSGFDAAIVSAGDLIVNSRTQKLYSVYGVSENIITLDCLFDMKGVQGDRGPTGGHYIPNVSSDGTLSWSPSDSKNMPTVASVSIKGVQGDNGLSAYEVAKKNGFEGTESEWLDSIKGETGSQGIEGKKGTTFTPSISGDGMLSWTNEDGMENPAPINIRGMQGEEGPPGKTPERGVDYWTDSDKEEIHLFVNDTINYVTPEMFGAKGDGITCDADAFIKALKTDKKVVCNSNSTYYFSKPVDVRTLLKGHFDGNNAQFINFHIYLNVNSDFNAQNTAYTADRFIIENMVLGTPGQIYDGWQTPCITCGSPIIIKNIITRSNPYIYAPVGSYIDLIQIEQWTCALNWSLFKDYNLSLDAISYLNSEGNYVRFDHSNYIQGDGWRISQCQEFYNHLSNNPNDYRFTRIGQRLPTVMEQCVQCSVEVLDYGQLMLIGCHFENAIITLNSNSNNEKITFINTFFYPTHKLIDTENVIYENCFFNCVQDKHRKTLAEITGNKSWYDLKCNLINCSCPSGFEIDTNKLKSYKNAPKKTYHYVNYNNNSLLNSIKNKTMSVETVDGGISTFFSESGDYTYEIYYLTTSRDDIAIAKKECAVNNIVATSEGAKERQYAYIQTQWVSGGTGFIIVRTNPDGQRYKTEYYTDPSICDDPWGLVTMNCRDGGSLCMFRIERTADSQKGISAFVTQTTTPWVKIDSVPSIDIIDNAYEANGVIVTTDDSPLGIAEHKHAGYVQVGKNTIDKLDKSVFEAHKNDDTHVTSTEKTLWNSKVDKDYVDEAVSKNQGGTTPVKGVDYFTDEDKEEIVDDVIDKTGLLVSVSYDTVTNNLCDEVYEYGYLNTDGTNQDGYTPITVSFRTKNYIPVEGGRTLCFNSWMGNGAGLNICQYDENKICIVNRTVLDTEVNLYSNNGMVLDSNTKYIRFTTYKTVENLDEVQINLFYYENMADMWSVAGDVFKYTPHFIHDHIADLVPKNKIMSPLTGKKIVYDGDSICESRLKSGSTYNGGAYAKIIADTVKCKYDNQAVSGARLTTKTGGEHTKHSIVDNVENLPKDGDLYCFSGGVNDVWSLTSLGECDMSDYTGDVDKTTICGALETIFRYALANFRGKPICFVITHKVSNINYENYKKYHDSVVAVCNKYSIPFYDAYNESGLNGWNSAQNEAFMCWDETNQRYDGCHPNEEGYKRYYVPQLISLFERIMPN